MPTIEDVAKLAGLSRTTVSRVMNNHPYVSEEKKALVRQAMEELGYFPNSSARRLRNQKTDTIAVLIPRITNPFFSQLMESLEIAASERGYKLIMCQTRYSKEKELNYLELLRTKQVDGIIMAHIENEWDIIKPFMKSGPIMLCNEFDEHAEVPMVGMDQEYGGFIAAEHLISLGHERIAYCSGGNGSNVAKAREKGFMRALTAHQLPIDENLFFRDASRIDDGKRVFHDIAALSERPTAVFTGSDEVAAGIIYEAKRHNWKIPDDLAVIGFDNQPISEINTPSISTINQPIEEMARTSLEIIINLIRKDKKLKQEIYEFPLKLMIRESTVKESDVVRTGDSITS